MSCVDFMYQFYSPYFSYKSPADDTSVQKFSSQPIYDAGITGTATSATTNNFLETPHLPHPHQHHTTTTSSSTTSPNSSSNNNTTNNNHHHHHHSDTKQEARDSDKNSPHHHPSTQPPQPPQPSQQQQQQQQQHHQQQHQQHPQPRTTHYLTANCVLFTYFHGEAGTVVDEHFSRALSQPSSFTLDKPPPNNKSYSRSESLLMCHRKLPPSFWNSAYQAPPCANSSAGGGNNFAAFGADAYFQSSLYNFHKTWPYHYSHHTQSHTYPHHQSATHGLPYPSMDTTGRLSSHYGSFMMPGPSLSSRVPTAAESRAHSQYDFSKTTDAFSNYYGMGRFGSDVETGLSAWS